MLIEINELPHLQKWCQAQSKSVNLMELRLKSWMNDEFCYWLVTS